MVQGVGGAGGGPEVWQQIIDFMGKMPQASPEQKVSEAVKHFGKEAVLGLLSQARSEFEELGKRQGDPHGLRSPRQAAGGAGGAGGLPSMQQLGKQPGFGNFDVNSLLQQARMGNWGGVAQTLAGPALNALNIPDWAKQGLNSGLQGAAQNFLSSILPGNISNQLSPEMLQSFGQQVLGGLPQAFQQGLSQLGVPQDLLGGAADRFLGGAQNQLLNMLPPDYRNLLQGAINNPQGFLPNLIGNLAQQQGGGLLNQLPAGLGNAFQGAGGMEGLLRDPSSFLQNLGGQYAPQLANQLVGMLPQGVQQYLPQGLDWANPGQAAQQLLQHAGGQLLNNLGGQLPGAFQQWMPQGLNLGDIANNPQGFVNNLGNQALQYLPEGVQNLFPNGFSSDAIRNLPIRDTVNNFIDQGVDTLFFDQENGLGLPRTMTGGGSKTGQTGAQWGEGMTQQNVQDWVMGQGAQFLGEKGNTLWQAMAEAEFGKVDLQAQGDWGSAYLQGSTKAQAGVRAYGDASLEDLSAYIGVEAGAQIMSDYRAGYKTPTVNLGGHEVGAQVDGRVYGMAGAVGRAEAGISLKDDPHITLGAEAFAGARAGVEGSAGLNVDGKELASVHGKAEAWAGVGARANLDVGFEDGKFRFGIGLGAALGVGFNLDWGFEIDFGAIADTVGDIAKDVVGGVVDFAEDAADWVGDAVDTVGDAIGDAADAVGDAVGDAADAVGEVVSDVGDAIGDAAEAVGDALTSW
ncbi:MAG: hypothetical protein HYV63_13200 [Candidatus Schekmanbacteria bacterium]|nr:hypothetical protein [Candidatus Schekmanbacteria bacterium]